MRCVNDSSAYFYGAIVVLMIVCCFFLRYYLRLGEIVDECLSELLLHTLFVKCILSLAVLLAAEVHAVAEGQHSADSKKARDIDVVEELKECCALNPRLSLDVKTYCRIGTARTEAPRYI